MRSVELTVSLPVDYVVSGHCEDDRAGACDLTFSDASRGTRTARSARTGGRSTLDSIAYDYEPVPDRDSEGLVVVGQGSWRYLVLDVSILSVTVYCVCRGDDGESIPCGLGWDVVSVVGSEIEDKVIGLRCGHALYAWIDSAPHLWTVRRRPSRRGYRRLGNVKGRGGVRAAHSKRYAADPGGRDRRTRYRVRG